MFLCIHYLLEFLRTGSTNCSKWKRNTGTLLFTCVLALMISARPGNTQPSLFPEEPTWFSEKTIGTTWSVAVGDVDGDGNLDLVCGNTDESSGLFNTLYLSDGGTLSRSPVWYSAQANVTISIALGDIDGDGDLDLACGNYDQSNTLYENTGGTFASTPIWSSDPTNATTSVALGDIDNDGDLDLACANYGQSNTLYLNEDGIISTTPAWHSDSTFITWDIALGDVNGDGYLDLVCGNEEASNTLYLNDGGVLPASPAWSSDSTSNTTCVALGDVNGDGYLDLVCANNIDEFYGKNRLLYLNEGGVFSTAPVWGVTTDIVTNDMALGDLDSDGDLDLVCAAVSESGAGNVAYLNTGFTFRSYPDWTAGSVIGTWALALGDVDSDGGLDMICGNYESNAIYSNTSSFLAPSPDLVWRYAPQAMDIDLADIDGNGYPDLVVGDYDWANLLYLNNEGIFDTLTSWESGQDSRTMSIDLGDVDGDGDLDLICGNDWENTLYLSAGGTFSGSPDWSSDAPQNSTNSIVLEDVDLDGDLDLICGNAGLSNGESNSLSLNDGGDPPSFTRTWLSANKSYTGSIALGDINQDGYPDLVCGNYGYDLMGERNTVYLNRGGVFSDNPDWYSDFSYTSICIALGDIDADGDLDLVCGNCGIDRAGQANTAYLNDGGVFASTPEWVSGIADRTSAIALEDIDFDGDLDLICGNAYYYPNGVPNTIYLNDGGTFSAEPDWTSQTREVTTCASLGDVDLDGDFDLVFGKAYGAELYIGTKAPVFKGSLSSPTNHLPNNGAFLRDVNVRKIAKNTFRVTLRTYDVESDEIWIVPEYQFEGVPEWYPQDIIGHTGKIGPMASSPEGIEHQFDWDVSTLPSDSRDVILRFKAISNPKRVASIQYIASYITRVGPIEPSRPELTTSKHVISFPTITVGDTTSLDVAIINVGNELLSITGITLPSTEIRLGLAVPFNIDPGDSTDLEVLLEPRLDTEIQGALLIESNDPLNPITTVQIETDIRALQVESNLLTPTLEAPLGEAATVAVTPADQVNVERGHLFFRAAGASAFLDSVVLSKFKNEFVALIPGDKVTESGLEYYIKVENSGVFGTDPSGAPDSFYTQAVESPLSITSEPVPNSGADYLAGREIKIHAILPTGAQFLNGALYYREGGSEGYSVGSLVLEGIFPEATVPDSIVGARGVEYWLDVQTETAHLSDPALAPSLHPHTIPVTVQNLVEPRSHAGGEETSAFRMMSIPLRFPGDFDGTIEALLSDQPAFGPYDPVKWRSWVYLPESGKYGELNNKSLAERFRPEPGRAFWLISRADHRISTAPVSGISTPTDGPFALELVSGWNMIGSVFAFPVSWDSVRVDTLSMSDAVGVTVDPPVRWSGGYSRQVPTMNPFEGYWIYNRTDNPVTLYIPPRQAQNAAPQSPALVAADAAGDGDFRMALRATSGDHDGSVVVIGTSSQATRALDRFDRVEPPPVPGQGLSLYLVKQVSDKRCCRLSTDIRPNSTGGGEWGEVWAIDLMKSFSGESAGDAVTVSVASAVNRPLGTRIVLIDRTLDREIALENNTEYTFYAGIRDYATAEDDTRFRIIVGTNSFLEREAARFLELPGHTALHQNHPNPFNPSTVIRYDVAEPGMVDLRIYNVAGALVRVLELRHRDRGRYEVGWNGENDRGEHVSSGVYFYKLSTKDFSQTKKMVLLK